LKLELELILGFAIRNTLEINGLALGKSVRICTAHVADIFYYCKKQTRGNLAMNDTTVTKVDSSQSPTGEMGQKYLASGKSLAMRLWENEQPDEAKESARRDYETVGYVIAGRAELHLEGQMVLLEKGDSWVVPKGASHTYKILEPFSAVEATHPPAHVHGRDE
jgi:quercetin dioxygenase-like cupin family protein